MAEKSQSFVVRTGKKARQCVWLSVAGLADDRLVAVRIAVVQINTIAVLLAVFAGRPAGAGPICLAGIIIAVVIIIVIIKAVIIQIGVQIADAGIKAVQCRPFGKAHGPIDVGNDRLIAEMIGAHAVGSDAAALAVLDVIDVIGVDIAKQRAIGQIGVWRDVAVVVAYIIGLEAGGDDFGAVILVIAVMGRRKAQFGSRTDGIHDQAVIKPDQRRAGADSDVFACWQLVEFPAGNGQHRLVAPGTVIPAEESGLGGKEMAIAIAVDVIDGRITADFNQVALPGIVGRGGGGGKDD